MNLVHVMVGVLLGAAFGYGGARLAPRWMDRPPRPWEPYVLAAVNGLLGGLLATGNPLNNYFWQHILFLSVLSLASLVDLHDRIIPNELVAFGLGAGLIMIFLLPYSDKSWSAALLGAAAGFGFLLFLAILVKGGMGLGDVKLAAVIGLFLGVKWVAMGLVLAFLLGGLVGATLLLLRVVGRKDHIPFGPYLALGAAITVLAGPKLWAWYTLI
jgi:leader peptidase (prepilin peptidase)/N-methyltransferase